MIGIVLFVVGSGIAVLFRLFRRSQIGESLSDDLRHLKWHEILVALLMSALLLVVAASLVFGWFVFSVETAQVVAGWKEPRTRSITTEVTAPTFTIPTMPTIPTLPTFPNLTFPEIPTPPSFPFPRPTTPLPGK